MSIRPRVASAPRTKAKADNVWSSTQALGSTLLSSGPCKDANTDARQDKDDDLLHTLAMLGSDRTSARQSGKMKEEVDRLWICPEDEPRHTHARRKPKSTMAPCFLRREEKSSVATDCYPMGMGGVISFSSPFFGLIQIFYPSEKKNGMVCKMFSDSEGDAFHWESCMEVLDEATKKYDGSKHFMFLGDSMDHGPSLEMAINPFCGDCDGYVLGNRDLNKLRWLVEMETWNAPPSSVEKDFLKQHETKPWAKYENALTTLKEEVTDYATSMPWQLLKLWLLLTLTMGVPWKRDKDGMKGGILAALMAYKMSPNVLQAFTFYLNLLTAQFDDVHEAAKGKGDLITAAKAFCDAAINVAKTMEELPAVDLKKNVLAFAKEAVVPLLKGGKLVSLRRGEGEEKDLFVCSLHCDPMGTTQDEKVVSVIGMYPLISDTKKDGTVRWVSIAGDFKDPNALTGDELQRWVAQLDDVFKLLLKEAVEYRVNSKSSDGALSHATDNLRYDKWNDYVLPTIKDKLGKLTYAHAFLIVSSLGGGYDPQGCAGPGFNANGGKRLTLPSNVSPDVNIVWMCGHNPRPFVEVARGPNQMIARMDTQFVRPNVCASLVATKNSFPDGGCHPYCAHSTMVHDVYGKAKKEKDVHMSNASEAMEGFMKKAFEKGEESSACFVGPIISLGGYAKRCIMQGDSFTFPTLLVDCDTFTKYMDEKKKEEEKEKKAEEEKKEEEARFDIVSFGKIFFYYDKKDYAEAVQMVQMKSPTTVDKATDIGKFKEVVAKDCKCLAKMELSKFSDTEKVHVQHGNVAECLYVTSTMIDPYLGMSVSKGDLQTMQTFLTPPAPTPAPAPELEEEEGEEEGNDEMEE